MSHPDRFDRDAKALLVVFGIWVGTLILAAMTAVWGC